MHEKFLYSDVKKDWWERCVAGEEAGQKLVTGARESIPRFFCFEIVPALPLWPFNTRILFQWGLGTDHTPDSSPSGPEHHEAYPCNRAGPGR